MGDSVRLVRETAYGDAKSSCAPGFSGVRRSAAAPDLCTQSPPITISSWNINGWTRNNSSLRENIIKYINSDIFCLIETHLDKDRSIDCDGYTCYLHNRSSRHRNPSKASGGIAILIKDVLFDKYKIEIIDKEIDGLMGIQLTDINTEFNWCCMHAICLLKNLPGDMIQILSLHIYYPLYISTVMQTRYFCGNFNGRVGKAADIVSGLDEDIPPRTCLDEVKRGHGDVLLELIKDGRLPVLNGRINPMADNFTCVSHRGRSVVD